MKKKFFVFFLIAVIAFLLTGCASGNLDGTSVPKSSPSGDYSAISPGGESGNGHDDDDIAAGQITAAEWNDNNHFEEWLELFDSSQESNEGIFFPYLQKYKFNTLNRLVINVTNNDQPVSGAVVKVYDDDILQFLAKSDAKGKAYLFLQNVTEEDSLRIEVQSNGKTETRQITYKKDMEEIKIEISDSAAKTDKIEIMFVIDTTGSMSDELNFLKAEIKDVITEVKQANPNTVITVALLFYRDIGDEYVTKFFDFSENIDTVKNNISLQSANGGGDYPEAVHTALSEAISKQWSSANSTKLLIHLLDAPPHGDESIMSSYKNSIHLAAEKGIRMIPVASSGIDKDTEYLLRNQSLITGGTYVFLTDDSGIGGEHLKPTIEGYVVEYLNALLVRVINEYHTGIAVAPVPYSQTK